MVVGPLVGEEVFGVSLSANLGGLITIVTMPLLMSLRFVR